MRQRVAATSCALGATLAIGLLAAGPRVAPIRYDRDVRPILSDRCFRCHGLDEAQRQAGLRLDTLAGATSERGEDGPALVPGRPEESLLLRRVSHTDVAERMPPQQSNLRALSPEQIDVMRRWIEEGAIYEPHWSFVPPVRPPLPDDDEWCTNPIDRFVLARLRSEGVAPSPPADASRLLRRVFLDLTGLPPTPEELDAPLSYEEWVERLLTEEPYRSRHAEHLASPWLDAARYADTCGIHTDAGRQIWLWRDWVLAALRDGMPFDRFLTEQLAGDLLPEATEAQKVASGFNRNHVTTDEGGAIAEEYLVEYAADRTATTSSVFLGLTLACARCHDHKYDPVSQADFYGFLAFFNSVDEPGLYSQLPDARRAFEPFLDVPSPAQREELLRYAERIAAAQVELDVSSPADQAALATFVDELPAELGLAWSEPRLDALRAAGGATLAVERGWITVIGPQPDEDEYEIELEAPPGQRLLLVQVDGGRADHGNAVLSDVTLEGASGAVPLSWAWADHEQANGDFAAVNVLDAGDAAGWALDGTELPGPRSLLFLADEPYGGSLRLRLGFHSTFARHAFARLRLCTSPLADPARLPVALGRWLLTGPFPARAADEAYAAAFGPERDARLDRSLNFGFGNQFWRHDPELADGRENALATGTGVTYLGRQLSVPTARTIELALGTDDGMRLFVDGVERARHVIDRSLSPDQERVCLPLEAGRHVLVLEVVNTGGDAGFWHRLVAGMGELEGDLVAALLPVELRLPELDARLAQAWRVSFSPGFRERREALATLEQGEAELQEAVPRTMVMAEMAEPRATFVLRRGQYDQPDEARPVSRGVPAAFGALPADAPADRLGLARWMVAPENPLVARVAVNRAWEAVFGTGLVETSEDFGHQGSWPSHPELLDWLAVELRESGWDLGHLLRLIVTSSTYRQESRVRPELAERDPENRWLASFPRRRLSAEQIRDQALYVSGLLVERFGGPSVKPYQPPGLWEEISMTASNTRSFEQGEGEELWRRSLYTYWKRASPPPSLSTFDAPTRESCTVRRASTTTPLQALVLWNDEQFVEAARALAQRTLTAGEGLEVLFRRCTGRLPDEVEAAALARALSGFRERFAAAPQDAAALLEVGEAPLDAALDPAELAAWTLLASAVLDVDATVTRS